MAGKSSLQNVATSAIIQEISDSNLETGRYVQNLESPRLSGRVDSTAINIKRLLIEWFSMDFT